MFNRSEKVFAGVLLIVCAIVGIVGYSFSRPSTPPRKVWFDAAGGDVIFAHAYHASLANCNDCHHDYDENAPEETEMNCRGCHYFGEEQELESPDPTHPRVIGANCTECHQDLGDAMSTCDTCHIRQGLAFEASGRVMPALPGLIKFDIEEAEVKDFDHKRHISEAVGEPCITCHHEFEGGKAMEGMEREKSCRACHYKLADNIPEWEEDDHVHYIGANCVKCHDTEDCSLCHKE